MNFLRRTLLMLVKWILSCINVERLTLVNKFSSTAFIPADEKHWFARLGDLMQAHAVQFHLAPTFDTAGWLQPASPINTIQPLFHQHSQEPITGNWFAWLKLKCLPRQRCYKDSGSGRLGVIFPLLLWREWSLHKWNKQVCSFTLA